MSGWFARETVMLALFLLFVTLVAVSATWANHLSRLEAEKTIRQAIEKGVLLDPELIGRLRVGGRRAGMCG
jgi:hypothetical protein